MLGRGDRHHAQCTAAVRKLECEPAAKRVAGDVSLLVARLVQERLEAVGHRRYGIGHIGRHARPAAVPGQRRHQQLVVRLEVRDHRRPGAPGVGEAVDQHQWLFHDARL